MSIGLLPRRPDQRIPNFSTSGRRSHLGMFWLSRSQIHSGSVLTYTFLLILFKFLTLTRRLDPQVTPPHPFSSSCIFPALTLVSLMLRWHIVRRAYFSLRWPLFLDIPSVASDGSCGTLSAMK